MSRKNALKPLPKRMNDYQRGRRATRIMARKTIAEALAQFLVINTEPMRRGFFGRLRWLLFGLAKPKQETTR